MAKITTSLDENNVHQAVLEDGDKDKVSAESVNSQDEALGRLLSGHNYADGAFPSIKEIVPDSE